MRCGRRWAVGAALGFLVTAAGCMHAPLHPHAAEMPPASPIAVPPPGAVPRELDKVTMPPYVIEAPDNLLIEVILYGKFPVLDDDGNPKKGPDGSVLTKTESRGLPVQQITGSFAVRPEGSVGLGFWGSVPVAGLTLEQAVEAIRQHIAQQPALKRFEIAPENVFVIVDVLAYNSKMYYVITDGGGFGEQVFRIPVYGSETVLDAIGNITGLPAVASKRNIWVARRTPHPGQPWQILPVDWVGITQHGVTMTNYQVMPGDRIYVKAQRLVTIDTALARVLSPIERVFGITLLGSSTVNQIQGRGNGFGGN